LLTVDYGRLGVRRGDLVLDVGAGTGRHAREAARRGAWVVALDLRAADLRTADGAHLVQGDALALPFADGTFDRLIASEVLEHIPDDGAAIAELRRVLKPGGRLAASVPRWFPERVCWALSDEYHSNPGGHVRIYRASELRAKLEAGGLRVLGRHHAHALHAPYWWVKCMVGPSDDRHPLPRLYHRFLVWDLMRKPRLTRIAECALNPILGKSVVLYASA
jgi:SAM-dependent methyltransferase